MIQLAVSLARNTARLAMSSGSPRRFVGRPRCELVAEVVDEHRGEVGLDQARRDADDPGRADLAGQLAGEVDQRRLGHVVDAEPELGAQAADRGDVDDHAGLVLERLVARLAATRTPGRAG